MSTSSRSYCASIQVALNKQIAVETAASFQYLAMHAYFDRPTAALKQAAAFFEKAQLEEIGHAKVRSGTCAPAPQLALLRP